MDIVGGKCIMTERYKDVTAPCPQVQPSARLNQPHSQKTHMYTTYKSHMYMVSVTGNRQTFRVLTWHSTNSLMLLPFLAYCSQYLNPTGLASSEPHRCSHTHSWLWLTWWWSWENTSKSLLGLPLLLLFLWAPL